MQCSYNRMISLLMSAKLLLVQLMLHATTAIQYTAPENRTIVGFYSSCNSHRNSSSNNKTELHKRAALYQQMTEERIDMPCVLEHCNLNKYRIYYVSVDVCEDHELLIERYLDLILDPKYSRRLNENWTSIEFLPRFYQKRKRQSRVDLIVSYLTQDMQTLLFRLDYHQLGLIPVFAYNLNVTIHPELHAAFYTVWGNTATDDMLHLSVLLRLFEWQRVGFLHLRNRSEPTTGIYAKMYQDFTKSLHRSHPDMCFYTETVDIGNKTHFDRAVRNLHSEYSANVVVLFGTEQDKTRFIKTTNRNFYTKHIWVVQDFEIRNIFEVRNKFPTNLPIRIVTLNNRLRKRLVAARKSLFRYRNRQKQLFVRWSGRLVEAAYAVIETVKWYLKLLKLLWKPFYKKTMSFIDMYAVSVNVDFVEFWRVNDPKLSCDIVKNFQRLFKSVFRTESSCHRLMCPPGWSQVGGQQYLPHQTKWDFEYGWTCQPCKENQVKPTAGNATCTACSLHSISNRERTKCYNPYRRVYKKRNLTYAICVASSILGVIASLFLNVVFMVHRNSPIGKSTDFGMTQCHLSTSFVLQIALLILHHIPRTTATSCFIVATVYASLYNLFVALALMKSHKLLKAFNAKQRATKRDRLEVFTQQIFIVALLVAIPVVVLFITAVNNTPGITEERNTTKYQILIFCSQPFQETVQLIYAMALQIACLVTAYRGRHLPSLFNESMALVYASLATTMALVAMFAVQAFRDDPLGRPLISWMVVSFNLNTFLLFLYGKKVWVMLYQKDKNTHAHVQHKTFEFAKQLAGKKHYKG